MMLDLRRQGVTEAGVLEALEVTPREMFVAEPFKDRAYEDVAFPIGHHQTLSQPPLPSAERVVIFTRPSRLNLCSASFSSSGWRSMV